MSAGPRPPFTRDRWRRLIPLLEQALELEGAARPPDPGPSSFDRGW